MKYLRMNYNGPHYTIRKKKREYHEKSELSVSISEVSWFLGMDRDKTVKKRQIGSIQHY